jgi:hypothetical protein
MADGFRPELLRPDYAELQESDVASKRWESEPDRSEVARF